MAHAGRRKGNLTSCRGTVLSARQKPPVSRQGGRTRLPARVSGRHVVRDDTVLTYPCPTASRVSVAVRRCARVTGKAGKLEVHMDAALLYKKPDLLTGNWSDGQCIQEGSKNDVCLYSGSSRIHNATSGTISTLKITKTTLIWYTSLFLCLCPESQGARPWPIR